ncbi:cytochrome P450 [Xylariaceae sp. FL0016]|nr:cytochrome P450 [Xylariaceae sp. FL0016]
MAAREALNLLRALGFSGVLGLAIVGFVIYLVIDSKKAGLDHIPGPWLARYTNLHAWKEANKNWGHDICYLRGLHQKYGDVVRVAPNRVSVCDPEAIPIIYSIKRALNKSELMRAGRPVGDGPENLFSVRDSKVHAQMRRTVANAYSMSTIVQYEPRIDDTLSNLLTILKNEPRETNLGRWIMYYVYDVAGNMTYSQPLGYLKEKNDALRLVRQTRALHKYVTLTMPMPILHDIFSFILRRIKVDNKLVFHRLSEQKVMERLQEVKAAKEKSDPHETNGLVRRPDILAHFIASKDKYPDLMYDEQIVTHCMMNIIAGVGTSTMSTVNALRYLAANQRNQERLYQELKGANVGCPATFRDTQHLPFLDALVREGIRLRGSDTFNPNGRVVGPEGLELPGGIMLPQGTVVGVKPSVASIQERTFGARPYEFIPERWCQAAGESDEAFVERRAKMDRGDMSFSAGTRSCIGRGIAMMQMYKLMATLVYKYKFIQAPREKPEDSNSVYDFICILEERNLE